MSQENTSEGIREPLFNLFMAAAFGSICCGFADLFNNKEAAAVLKIGEVIRLLYPPFGGNYWIALVMLIAFSIGLCWIYQPQTRVDAFLRGLSVFAVLSAASPYNSKLTSQPSNPEMAPKSSPVGQPNVKNPYKASSIFRTLETSEAFAQSLQETDTKGSTPSRFLFVEEQQRGIVTFALTSQQGFPAPEFVTVTVRDADTARVISAYQAEKGNFVIVQPPGKYLVEVAAPGYQRSQFIVEVGTSQKWYEVSLEQSNIPLPLQRLVSPASIQLREKEPLLSDEDVGTWVHNYKQALEDRKVDELVKLGVYTEKDKREVQILLSAYRTFKVDLKSWNILRMGIGSAEISLTLQYTVDGNAIIPVTQTFTLKKMPKATVAIQHG